MGSLHSIITRIGKSFVLPDCFLSLAGHGLVGEEEGGGTPRQGTEVGVDLLEMTQCLIGWGRLGPLHYSQQLLRAKLHDCHMTIT